MLETAIRHNGSDTGPSLPIDLRDLHPPDPRELVRALDTVPDRVESAIGNAGESLRASVHRLSAPRRRSRMPSATGWLALVIAGVALLGLLGLTLRRFAAPTPVGAGEPRGGRRASAGREPQPTPVPVMAPAAGTDKDADVEAIDRALGEGMGTTPGAEDRVLTPTPVAPGILDRGWGGSEA